MLVLGAAGAGSEGVSSLQSFGRAVSIMAGFGTSLWWPFSYNPDFNTGEKRSSLLLVVCPILCALQRVCSEVTFQGER